MKKLTLFTSSIIALLLSFSLIFTACEKDPEPEPPITTPSITLGESSVVMGNISGSKSVTFKTNTDWSIKVDETKAPDWLTVAPMSGVAGDITLTVTAKQNETYDDRAAKVTITAGTALKTIEVSQKKLGALTLSKNEFMLPQEGGPIEIELTTNLDYSVTMSSWITQIQTKGLETHHLQFSVDPNYDYDDRTGEIVIKDNETGLSEAIVVKQKKLGALTVTKDEYTIESKGGYIDIELATNIEYELTMSSWITQIQTKGLETHHLQFSIDPNDDYDRTGEIIIKDKYSDLYKTIVVKQKGTIELSILQLEREALMALYKSTNGPNWINNTNWGGDKPVSEWFGITCDSDGRVEKIDLQNNNLSGRIPPEIGTFKNLKYLWIRNNPLTGKIPEEIGNLVNMINLDILNTQISGSIPASLSKCKNLQDLRLASNLLSGPIPEGIFSIITLYYVELGNNNLSGTLPSDFTAFMDRNPLAIYMDGNRLIGPVPDNILNHPNWNKYALSITNQQKNYGFDMKSTPIYVKEAKLKLTDDKEVMLSDIYRNNDLTIYLLWAEWCWFSQDFILNDLMRLYSSYSSNGLEILGAATTINSSEEAIKKFVSDKNIPWPTSCDIISSDVNLFFSNIVPAVLVLDKDGRVIFNNGDRYELESLIVGHFGDPEDVELYKSTDYSRDGEVRTIQTATKGKGIDLVFMGDGFTDKDINSGLYDSQIYGAIDGFFSIEPVKSHREYFNIYSVTAVSQNDVYGYQNSKTAFDVFFGDGTHMGGNDQKCGEYALKTPIKGLENTLITVVTKSLRWAGTCYMYGDGSAISYTSTCTDGYAQRLLVQHESVGHGFGKLADEYTSNDGYIPAQIKAEKEEQWQQLGWWANIDFTNDPGKVKWKHFIDHPKYDYVDFYEGGGLYTRGVWTPEYTSAMDAQWEYFNAPSREAIYKKIMELAGETYSFNKFVSQDNVTPPIETRSTQESRPPTTPPVVRGYSILD